MSDMLNYIAGVANDDRWSGRKHGTEVEPLHPDNADLLAIVEGMGGTIEREHEWASLYPMIGFINDYAWTLTVPGSKCHTSTGWPLTVDEERKHLRLLFVTAGIPLPEGESPVREFDLQFVLKYRVE